MEQTRTIDGALLARMVRAGAARLRSKADTVNDLNVFPIPDGDTGSNMLLTALGGVEKGGDGADTVSEAARRISDGMLLSARGNSGVILSQIFDGIASGLSGLETADCPALIRALQCGTEQAYQAVMEPTEGTMLTVMRCATDYAAQKGAETPDALCRDFLDEARRTLERTPDLLPVLKRAGVVDSGGAGLIYIVEGMRDALSGTAAEEPLTAPAADGGQALDLDRFTEDSVLEYGYCTELLLRLQRCKTDVAAFPVDRLTDYLKGIGDSVVIFKTGSIVKIHIHTMTPDRVLAFCQRYGEFLKVKIENMSLQHNNITTEPAAEAPQQERKPYGVVAVASGAGMKQLFIERGADVVVDGGQSSNPSAEDFLAAFRQTNADTIFVLPNNGNIILAAKQAAGMYPDADVRVIESHTVGDGYAALSMYSTDSDDPDEIAAGLTEAMQGVVTAEVSRSVRDAQGVHAGEYIGISGKEILAADPSRLTAACRTAEQLGLADYDICLLLRGRDADPAEAEELRSALLSRYPGKEIYLMDGLQEVYDYILILE